MEGRFPSWFRIIRASCRDRYLEISNFIQEKVHPRSSAVEKHHLPQSRDPVQLPHPLHISCRSCTGRNREQYPPDPLHTARQKAAVVADLLRRGT